MDILKRSGELIFPGTGAENVGIWLIEIKEYICSMAYLWYGWMI